MRGWAVFALALCGCGSFGKTLEISLTSGCANLNTAETVRIEVATTPAIANGTRDLLAREVFAGGTASRLLLLFPEEVQSVDVTIRVLEAGGAERVSGSTSLPLLAQGNHVRAVNLAATACPTPPDLGGQPDLAGADLTGLDLTSSGCGVLRLTGGFANAPSISDYNPSGDFTLEAWIYVHIPAPAPPPTARNIIGHWGLGSGGTASYMLYVTSDMRPAIAISCNGTTGSPNFQSLSSPNPISMDRWYHIAGEYQQSGQLGRVFVDGTAVQSGNLGCASAHPITGIPLEIAYNDAEGGKSFLGDLDEVRVSLGNRYVAIAPFPAPRELTADANTLALFRFEPPGSSGSTAADSSPRNNAAMLSGAALLSTNCRP